MTRSAPSITVDLHLKNGNMIICADRILVRFTQWGYWFLEG